MSNGKTALSLYNLVLLALCLLVPGCKEIEMMLPTPEPHEYPVMQYYAWLASGPRVEKNLETARLEAITPTALTLVDKVQLAMILSLFANNPGSESDARALALLPGPDTPPAYDESVNEYLAFSALLGQLLEQRNQPEPVQIVQEIPLQPDSLIEENNVFLKQENAILQKQRTLLEQRNRFLEDQLEALTTIERQMIEREFIQD
jgi:hypothetical protein